MRFNLCAFYYVNSINKSIIRLVIIQKVTRFTCLVFLIVFIYLKLIV